MNDRSVLLRRAVVGALALITAPAFGQEASEPQDSRTIDTIIVTAQKREQSLQDVPIVVTAVGANPDVVRDGIDGLVVDHEHQANFVPLNTADDWLHFVLGVGIIGAAGFYAWLARPCSDRDRDDDERLACVLQRAQQILLLGRQCQIGAITVIEA